MCVCVCACVCDVRVSVWACVCMCVCLSACLSLCVCVPLCRVCAVLLATLHHLRHSAGLRHLGCGGKRHGEWHHLVCLLVFLPCCVTVEGLDSESMPLSQRRRMEKVAA